MKPVTLPYALNALAHSPEGARSAVETFEITLGKNGPRVCGFVELKRGPFLTDGIAELLKTTVRQSLQPLPQLGELEERFEDAVLEANDVLAKHFSRDEDASDHLIAAALMLLAPAAIYFTATKEARAYLVRSDAKHWENLLGTDGGGRTKNAFGSLFSGTVAAGDSLVLASRTFFDGVSQEALRAMLKKNEADIATQIEHALVDPEVPVAALLVRGTPSPTAAARPNPKKRVPAQSWPLPSLAGAGKATRAFAAGTTRSLAWLIDRMLPPAEPEDSESTANAPAEEETTTQPRVRMEMPNILRNRKVILVGLLVVIALGLSGFAAYRSRDARERARYNQQLEDIAAAERDAEMNLAAHDTNRAQQDLKHAQEILASVSLTTAARKSRAAVMTKELDALAAKFQFVRSAEPKTILSFSSDSTNGALHPTLVIPIVQDKKNLLLLIDGKLRTAATIDPNAPTPQLNRITVDASAIGEIVSGMPTETGALLVTRANGLAELVLGTAAKIESRSIDNPPTSISAAALYQKKLYIVDGPQKRITKHVPTAGGFGKGQVWISNEAQLADAMNLAIDGALWMTSSSGQLWRYYQGARTPFTVAIDPALSGPLRVFTTVDSPYLYVLEPKGHRVVVLLKESDDQHPLGTLMAQYVVDRWTDLKSFTVNEHDKALYVLNGDALEKIALTHLDAVKLKNSKTNKPKTTAAPTPAKKKSTPTKAEPKKTP